MTADAGTEGWRAGPSRRPTSLLSPKRLGGGEEIAMADAKTIRAPQEGELISLTEYYEVEYWTRKFGVSKERLAEAVHRVGHSAKAVEAELSK